MGLMGRMGWHADGLARAIAIWLIGPIWLISPIIPIIPIGPIIPIRLIALIRLLRRLNSLRRRQSFWNFRFSAAYLAVILL